MNNCTSENYYKDNVFIIGDAAHQFPPSGGYGLNSGISDTFSLFWRLIYLLKSEKLQNINGKVLKDTFNLERKTFNEVLIIFILINSSFLNVLALISQNSSRSAKK